MKNNTKAEDEHWLRYALSLAERAQLAGEVPVGAVLVVNNEALGSGWNQPITTHDPSAHAEIIALRDAAMKLKNYRLVDSTLYVTIEPCVMCAGAIIHARVKRVVFGADEPKHTGVENTFTALQAFKLNHQVQVESGVLAQECAHLLKNFFAARRAQ